MPRLATTPDVTTTTEVQLSTKLQTKLKLELKEYEKLHAQKKVLEEKLAEKKNVLETLFADSDEYEALLNGAKVHTSFGVVSLKIVKGMTAGRLNLKKLMVKFKLTPKDIDGCKDAGKPKKEYLKVTLPGEDKEEGED